MLTAPETPAHRSAPLDAEAEAWKQVAESRLSTILLRDQELLDLLKENMRLPKPGGE